VLFGRQKDEALYNKALKDSCLDEDLAQMSADNRLSVEEGASNLSGGQKTRICLARAIYADKPILLLDDPLSSLDSRVANRLIKNLSFLSKAEGKTIVLASHNISCLSVCDRFIEVASGTVKSMTNIEFRKIHLEEAQE
jgi:ATP-binding cassette subfamily C (CFTR/MRP) protein 4